MVWTKKGFRWKTYWAYCLPWPLTQRHPKRHPSFTSIHTYIFIVLPNFIAPENFYKYILLTYIIYAKVMTLQFKSGDPLKVGHRSLPWDQASTATFSDQENGKVYWDCPTGVYGDGETWHIHGPFSRGVWWQECWESNSSDDLPEANSQSVLSSFAQFLMFFLGFCWAPANFWHVFLKKLSSYPYGCFQK